MGIRIILDEVVSYPIPGRPREIESDVELPTTLEEVLRSAGIPVGLVGYVVSGERVLELGENVRGPEPIELYGIYDGG